MRLVVFSQNRLAGLGVASLANSCGYEAVVRSVDEACATARFTFDLALLYGNEWNADYRQAVARIHALHMPFLVVLRDMDAALRRDLLQAGTLHAFHHGEYTELAAVLANFLWSMSSPPDEFVLANDFTVNLVRGSVQRGGCGVGISLTECKMLAALRAQALTRGTQPISPSDLNQAVWGDADARRMSTLRSHISRLRDKVEVDSEHPEVLCGRRKQGYWLLLSGVRDG